MNSPQYPPLLSGLRVLDLSHQYSGALAASLLADLGASVVVVEHPSGAPIRSMLPKVENESLWWKVLGRGKQAVSLQLSTPRGRDLFFQMLPHFDVVIENFRPGTLEKWGIGPTDIEAAGHELLMLRISGFGQTGPMRERPGFGTAAEAMSGFAHLNGDTDGPPTFPSTTLADGVTAVFGVFGLMAALASRRGGNPGPRVEVVDSALFESLFRLIPTQVPGYDQLGRVPIRPGNALFSHGSLRNLYTSGDGRHFVVASVGAPTIRRVLEAVEAHELAAATAERMKRSPEEVEAFLWECDAHIKHFVKDRDYAEIAEALTSHGAVFQLVYSVEDIFKDEQFAAREDLVSVPDQMLGEIVMQGIVPKFAGRGHRVREAGHGVGAHNSEVYGRLLNLSEAELADLSASGVI